jgi:hypothetical protein
MAANQCPITLDFAVAPTIELRSCLPRSHSCKGTEMKRTWVVKSIAFMMAMGLGVPGCFLAGNDEKSEGRICASPVEGGNHCVSSSSGPSAAWNKAAAAGSEPIQMWAVWPEDVELNEIIAFPTRLEMWLDDVQTVIDYLRITQRNAESYHASLSGKLGDDIREVSRLQNEIIKGKAADPKKRVEQLLFDKAVSESEPLKAEITADKQTIGDVLTIVDQAKVDGAPFASLYKKLVDDFATYRATEATETAAYAALAKDASNALVSELDAVEKSILDAAHTASAKPNELLVAGMKLNAQILQFENGSREAMAPHADFMSNHGASVPDLSSGALRSIHAILGYAEQRVTRSDATAKGLLLGAGMRRQALQLLATAPSPVRATIANAMLVNASTKFQNMALVHVDVMAAISMSSTGLPYLAQRYDEYTSLLQIAPLCNVASSSWREAGCVSMRPKIKDATKYLKVTLPVEISNGLDTMKNQGVDPVAIEKVRQKLKAGDIKGAALAHDVLVNSLEGT